MTVPLDLTVDELPLRIDSDGVARVGQTRVTLDTVVTAFNEGATAEEITQQYPSLGLADVYQIIGYYLRRRDEVEAYLHERQTDSAAIRQATETRFDPDGLRERLLARQHH